MVGPVTESNLITAYAAENKAHKRYLKYADRAEEKGYTNICRLFKAVAFAEKIHAGNHYKNIQKKSDTHTVSEVLTESSSDSGLHGRQIRHMLHSMNGLRMLQIKRRT